MKKFEELIREKKIKELAYSDLEKYLANYKKEEYEDYCELFNGVSEDNVNYVFHSISYVLDEIRFEDEIYKYILVKIYLESNDEFFAEYSVSYDLNAECLDDYLLKI